jgi:hypothetical protein
MAQPVHLAPPIAAQQPDLEQRGNFQARDVIDLTEACIKKDAENGSGGQKVIIVATMITAIAALFLIEGILGVLVFAATLLFAGDLASIAYHKYRGHEYLDASKALATEAFKQFVANKKIEPNINNILIVHRLYQEYAIEEAGRIGQRV